MYGEKNICNKDIVKINEEADEEITLRENNKIINKLQEEAKLSSLWTIYRMLTDDKHRCKVRESGFPVAAIERRKKVVVSRDTTFKVADHDYTKTGIIPSVIMICNIPESINGDFYTGQ
ncbi:7640_t:CDS:2, partial [Scutellospora calospora]